MPAASSFEGLGDGLTGSVVGGIPSDDNGAVGPTQYVQVVNSDLAVFSKSTGLPVLGPVRINTLWAGFGGGCEANNDGDPTAIYDRMSDRWVISQFSISSQPFLQCVAVSTTGDATGSYNRYSFSYGSDFPDYPKMGAWPDGYYTTFNMFNAAGSAFLGPKICAYDRVAMLAGDPATQQCFDLSTDFGAPLPADLDGAALPPAGSPNYLLGLGLIDNSANNTQLDLWQFHVDWLTPANSTLSAPAVMTASPYQVACGSLFAACIPQAGTSQLLDTLNDRLMYRVAYRNFGDHESLVANHSVKTGGTTGVRWYEVRSPGTTPTIYQEGTHSPDATHRWMASAAMDGAGDVAVGYSASSASINPGIRYAGRLVGDPLGTLPQTEATITAGTGSQTTYNRWGDYTAMQIDPVDDCTFWYTNQYLTTTDVFNWHTRIASFKFPSCTGSKPVVSAQPSDATVTSGSNAAFTASAAGTPTPTVQWQQSSDGGATFTDIAGATSNTLPITGSTPAQSGRKYRAVFTNAAGSTLSSIATLTVNFAPQVTTAPTNVTVLAGANADFTAAATGRPAPTVQWQLSTNGGVSFADVAGATSTTFTLPSVTVGQNGAQVRAVFSNLVGTATTTPATLTVSSPPTPAPTIASITPASGRAIGGTPLTIGGSGFQVGATVAIDGRPATSVVVVTPGTITAATPQGTLGAKSVTVTNPGGASATRPAGFTYVRSTTTVVGWPTRTVVARTGRTALKSTVVKVTVTPSKSRRGVVQTPSCRRVGARVVCRWVNVRTVAWPAGVTGRASIVLTALRGRSVVYRLVLPASAFGTAAVTRPVAVRGA